MRYKLFPILTSFHLSRSRTQGIGSSLLGENSCFLISLLQTLVHLSPDYFTQDLHALPIGALGSVRRMLFGLPLVSLSPDRSRLHFRRFDSESSAEHAMMGFLLRIKQCSGLSSDQHTFLSDLLQTCRQNKGVHGAHATFQFDADTQSRFDSLFMSPLIRSELGKLQRDVHAILENGITQNAIQAALQKLQRFRYGVLVPSGLLESGPGSLEDAMEVLRVTLPYCMPVQSRITTQYRVVSAEELREATEADKGPNGYSVFPGLDLEANRFIKMTDLPFAEDLVLDVDRLLQGGFSEAVLSAYQCAPESFRCLVNGNVMQVNSVFEAIDDVTFPSFLRLEIPATAQGFLGGSRPSMMMPMVFLLGDQWYRCMGFFHYSPMGRHYRGLDVREEGAYWVDLGQEAKSRSVTQVWGSVAYQTQGQFFVMYGPCASVPTENEQREGYCFSAMTGKKVVVPDWSLMTARDLVLYEPQVSYPLFCTDASFSTEDVPTQFARLNQRLRILYFHAAMQETPDALADFEEILNELKVTFYDCARVSDVEDLQVCLDRLDGYISELNDMDMQDNALQKYRDLVLDLVSAYHQLVEDYVHS